ENPVLLAETILKLKNNPDILDYLGNNGRDFAQKYYDRTVLADNYERILTQVLEQRGNFKVVSSN
ncbi:MAG: hypothetical protein M1308_18430, partial [Actinobacteria bacterium]|nr:hypothetical protein [Actinomycetota bacterium]